MYKCVSICWCNLLCSYFNFVRFSTVFKLNLILMVSNTSYTTACQRNVLKLKWNYCWYFTVAFIVREIRMYNILDTKFKAKCFRFYYFLSCFVLRNMRKFISAYYCLKKKELINLWLRKLLRNWWNLILNARYFFLTFWRDYDKLMIMKKFHFIPLWDHVSYHTGICML